ncbi:MAG: glycosyltransferase, partial [Pseudomonadota bacterium]
DTFGLVMLEAMACGVPVAAYPVPGPIDVVHHGQTGFLDEDLGKACAEALKLSRETCRQHALNNSWAKCSEVFASYLVGVTDEIPPNAPTPVVANAAEDASERAPH